MYPTFHSEGLIHEGDELKEVNGVAVDRRKPKEILPLLVRFILYYCVANLVFFKFIFNRGRSIKCDAWPKNHPHLAHWIVFLTKLSCRCVTKQNVSLSFYKFWTTQDRACKVFPVLATQTTSVSKINFMFGLVFFFFMEATKNMKDWEFEATQPSSALTKKLLMDSESEENMPRNCLFPPNLHEMCLTFHVYYWAWKMQTCVDGWQIKNKWITWTIF